jgi:hypothetical protein
MRLGQPGLFVGDTGVLMNEVVQATRSGRATSLLVAMCQDTVRVHIARHVLIEVERDLPGFARGRGLDPHLVMASWNRLYKPLIVVVDVPDTWADDNQAVQSVVNRHPVDAPTARLAAALAPCYALIEDPDLTDYGLGDRNWLPLTHAFANQAEVELVGSMVAIPASVMVAMGTDLGRAAIRLPVALRCLVVAGLLGVAYLWQKDGRARRHMQKSGEAASRVAKVAGPPLLELLERHGESMTTQQDRLVPADEIRGLAEQIARELALAPDHGLLAVDIARVVDFPGNLKARTSAVRTLLEGSNAYNQVARGRWLLGSRTRAITSTLTPDDIAQWLARAHRATLPQPSREVARAPARPMPGNAPGAAPATIIHQ